MPVHILCKYLLHPCRRRHGKRGVYYCMGYFMRQHAVRDIHKRDIYSLCLVVVKGYWRFSEVAYAQVYQFQFLIRGINVYLEMKLRRIHLKELLDLFHNPVNPVFCQSRILFLAFAEKLKSAADFSCKVIKVFVIRIVNG